MRRVTSIEYKIEITKDSVEKGEKKRKGEKTNMEKIKIKTCLFLCKGSKIKNVYLSDMPMISLVYKEIYFNTMTLIIIFLMFVFFYYRILKTSFLMRFFVGCHLLRELSTKLVL
jgi:hypothetical protein